MRSHENLDATLNISSAQLNQWAAKWEQKIFKSPLRDSCAPYHCMNHNIEVAWHKCNTAAEIRFQMTRWLEQNTLFYKST
jgi:hypothetical protein